jgi:hypothetical protein
MVCRVLVVMIEKCGPIVAIVSQAFPEVYRFGMLINVWGMVENIVACVPNLVEDDIP